MQPQNLKEKIEKGLPQEVKKIIYECAKIAHISNYRIFLVGGIVRDLLLDKKTLDIDITVQGDAIEFSKILETQLGCKIIQIQNDLKTAKVRFLNDVEIDFASTRQEEYPLPGHLPVLKKTGCILSHDVKRRDFSINAIAAALNSDSYGRIIDYTGGLTDLKNQTLKVLHEKSFIDDPSRIIRGLKFSVRLGFKLDEKTKKLQNEYLINPNRNISWARIKSELKQTFSLHNPKAFDTCIEQQIYKIFTDTTNKNIKGQEIFDIVENYKSEISDIWLIYFGSLITDIKTIELFSFSKNEKKILTEALDLINTEIQTDAPYEIYKFFENKHISSIIIFYLVTKNTKAIQFLEKLRFYKSEITGTELIELGFIPCAQFGEIFDMILKERLVGNIKNKADEINFIKTLKNS